ncbi:MAG: nucleotidyltransferase domain-containing protein [Elusimicrobiota bacterium]
MIFNSRSKISSKILNYFFLNEKVRIYVNELARKLEEEPKNVYRILLSLEESGILTSEFSGRERYFFLNRKNRLLKEYKTIFFKTAGLEAILKKAVAKIPDVKEAYIYGSYANKRYKSGSDIDLLLIGNHKRMDAQKIIYEIQQSLNTEINILNLTEENFRKRKEEKDQLITSVFGGKVIKIL